MKVDITKPHQQRVRARDGLRAVAGLGHGDGDRRHDRHGRRRGALDHEHQRLQRRRLARSTRRPTRIAFGEANGDYPISATDLAWTDFNGNNNVNTSEVRGIIDGSNVVTSTVDFEQYIGQHNQGNHTALYSEVNTHLAGKTSRCRSWARVPELRRAAAGAPGRLLQGLGDVPRDLGRRAAATRRSPATSSRTTSSRAADGRARARASQQAAGTCGVIGVEPVRRLRGQADQLGRLSGGIATPAWPVPGGRRAVRREPVSSRRGPSTGSPAAPAARWARITGSNQDERAGRDAEQGAREREPGERPEDVAGIPRDVGPEDRGEDSLLHARQPPPPGARGQWIVRYPGVAIRWRAAQRVQGRSQGTTPIVLPAVGGRA